MIKIGPKLPKQNTTPATRDLMRFISPNPSAVDKVQWFSEINTTDLKNAEADFQKWESKNICALVVDSSNCPPIRAEDYLTKALEVLSYPILRYQSMRDQDELFDSRLLGFHGQITPVGEIGKNAFFELNKIAESIHFRLIPAVMQKSDWEIISPVAPRFVFIHSDYTDELPPVIKNSRTWLIGNAAQKEKYKLKCVVES